MATPAWRAGFCAAIAAGELRVIEATPHDYGRMAELLTTYASLRLEVVDACVIALAERLDVREAGPWTGGTSLSSHHSTCPRASG